MKRNPKEEFIKDRMKSVHIRKIYPLLYWTKCNNCGMEFKREFMYRCERVGYMGMYEHVIGCSHCFKDEADFIEWLKENDFLYTEESLSEKYDNPLWRFKV